MVNRTGFCIKEIASFIPPTRLDNTARAEAFDYTMEALTTKIGIQTTSRMDPDWETSDLALAACQALNRKLPNGLDIENVDLLVVVTQHPDGFGLPHCSAILHAKLGLPDHCFAFDISLGCSGYVAALATVSGYLLATNGKRALLVTADPYSKSLSEDDKNTAMIFGDAATATLIEPGDTWQIGAFDLGTKGEKYQALQRDENGVLRMNGRAVFDFCAMNIPKSLKRTLEANALTLDQIDAYALHPGSKYIVDTVCKRAGIPAVTELPCAEYGNTISSSIPLILEGFDKETSKTILVSGFGVGLGWATTILSSQEH